MSFVRKLPKTIFDKANALGVTSILLQFSGGSDEGRLEVDFTHVDGTSHFDGDESSAAEWPLSDELEAFANEVYEWAEAAYEYSGDGGDYLEYGDDITYDLQNKKVSHESWESKPVYDDALETELEIKEGE